MTDLIRGKCGQRHPQGTPCEDGGRGWSDVTARQGTSGITGDLRRSKRHGIDSPLEPPEETNLANAMTLDFCSLDSGNKFLFF